MKKNEANNMSNKDLDGIMCVKHPYRPAKAFCAICGKPYCEADLTKIGNEYVCYDCLRALVKKYGKEPTVQFKSITLPVLFTALVFSLLTVYFVFAHIEFLPKLGEDLKSPEARIFIRDLIIALFFGIEVLLVLLTNKNAFVLGIFLSLWIMLNFLTNPVMDLPELTTEYIVFRIILPILGILGLMLSKKNLVR